MASLVSDLLPIVLVAAVMPGLLIMLVIVLESPNGVAKGAALVAGMLTTRILLGALVGFIYSVEASEGAEKGGVVQATLAGALGILLLVTGIRLLFKQEDPDASSPRWMSALAELDTRRAFLFGMGGMAIALKHWFFIIAAVQIIAYAQLGLARASLAYLIFVLLASLTVILPVLVCVLSPTRSKIWLGQLQRWLEANDRKVKIVVSFVFGLLFVWKGFTGMMA